MNSRFERWLNLAQYEDRVKRDRALRLVWVLVFLVVFSALQFVIDLVMVFAGTMTQVDPVMIGVFFGIIVLSIVSGGLLRNRHLEVASNLVIIMLLVAVIAVGWAFGLSNILGGSVPLCVLIVVAIARRSVAVVYGVASMFAGAVLIVYSPQGTQDSAAQAMDIATMTIITGLTLGTALTLITTLQQTTQRAEARLRNMLLSSQMSTKLGTATDVAALAEQAIDVIWDAYTQVDYARVFVIEDNRVTMVRNSDEEGVGATDLQQAPPLDGPGILGRTNTTRQAVLLRDTSEERVYPGDRLRPDTRAVLALPLNAGDMIVGVLELQSALPGAFSDTDVDALQPIADLVAVNLARTRTLEAHRQQAEAAERHLSEARSGIAKVSRESQREVTQTWDQYLRGLGGGQSIQLDLETLTTLRYEAWTPTLRDAINQDQPVVVSGTEGNVVAVPIHVGGQIIGAMEFEMGRAPSEQDVAMINQVSERLGVSAENTRLFFEARRVADREVQVNEIGARLQAVTDLDAMLVAAAEGLSMTLGTPRVSVRIGVPPSDGAHNGGAA